MKCAIFLAEGFEPCEGLITIDMLKRAKMVHNPIRKHLL